MPDQRVTDSINALVFGIQRKLDEAISELEASGSAAALHDLSQELSEAVTIEAPNDSI